MKNKPTYDLEERLLEYATRIIRLTESMSGSQTKLHVSNQLLRSGTAPMAHHGESQAAESPKDFIHKLRIALKELRESLRWLKLIRHVPLVDKPELLNPLIDETDQLIRIFHTSIETAKKKL
jgi:four helix bundle protein